jgi:hypothetical protein
MRSGEATCTEWPSTAMGLLMQDKWTDGLLTELCLPIMLEEEHVEHPGCYVHVTCYISV